jgi:hypothetical protein
MRSKAAKNSAANSPTELGDFNGFLKVSIIEKPVGVVAHNGPACSRVCGQAAPQAHITRPDSAKR